MSSLPSHLNSQLPASPLRGLRPGTLAQQLMAIGTCMGLAAGTAHAEAPPERTEVQFKMLDYRETQPGADRVAVRASSLAVNTPVGDWASVAISQTIDAISGASPAYHTQRLTPLKDFRRAWTAAGTVYTPRTTFTLSAADSRESDYFSKAVSAQGTWATESKNTTLTAGYGLSSDTVRPSYGGFEDYKHVRDALVGITQVLTPRDIVQANLSHAWSQGYLTDPYKLLDERPRTRHATRLLLRWNHHLGDSDQVLRTSWRTSTDSWGVKAHTASVEWVVPVGQGWVVTPSLRAHTQTAANFYLPVDPTIAPAPPFPPDGALYYSADSRLSTFGAWTPGLRLDKRITRDWSVDVKVERYEQRGAWAWAGKSDPGLAPFRATWIQLGTIVRF